MMPMPMLVFAPLLAKRTSPIDAFFSSHRFQVALEAASVSKPTASLIASLESYFVRSPVLSCWNESAAIPLL